MKKFFKSGSLVQQNYLQLLFVFAAFALMALAAYFFIGRIVRDRLMRGVEALLYSAESNVKAGLTEAETTLLNSYHIVQEMVERDASHEEILNYLVTTTEWMSRRDQGLFGFFGIYGYINGEFYDGIGLNPDENYIPQKRPWYQAAVRIGSDMGYTAPYVDPRTGDVIISAVRNINISSGETVGILAVDLNIGWLKEYVKTFALTSGSHGILLSQNMTVMAHPDPAMLGSQLQDLGGSYEDIARTLRNGNNVFAQEIKDTDGSTVIVFFQEIFNGWYVGSVTPSFQFYRDLYISAMILTLLGISLSIMLCYILLRLSEAKIRSDEESKYKSSFLANMSHEIRTPMNAINGMAELLLREDLPERSRSYVQDIKQAGANLIAIINDLLDFSKIEAGKLEIIPGNYLLASLINDTVSIIRLRISEKPIRFFTNVDSTIPNGLIGDEVRLRQILLNLLSNAVKYTLKGNISISITQDRKSSEQVWLKIAVSDTGQGIKPEDCAKLFGEFIQVDTKKNRGIEGTGLGLAITKKLCLAMGGDIRVESEYGKGSTFTFMVPQGIHADIPFAAVDEPEKKKVLVYERRSIYSQSVCWSLENLKVPYTLVNSTIDFIEALRREEWYFVFSGYGLYEWIKPELERSGNSFPGGKKPLIALMVEWGAEAYIPNVRFMSLPVQSLSIANTLNGKDDVKGYFKSEEGRRTIRFTIPHARLLLVDDISTNLKVAEGLLSPYNPVVDTCLSGPAAIELVKNCKYDLILMDHMMPDMDGIEATAIIRKMDNEYSKIPIIALTANAVSGMKEMFIENGFDDFLAKPIDVAKLDDILNRWIPKEKRGHGTTMNQVSNSPLPVIPGLDTKKGIAMTGGTVEGYCQVLSLFCKDAEERLTMLRTVPEQNNLHLFVTQVHALKSAAASVGAALLSTEAAALEAAGRAGDLDLLARKLPAFYEHLAKLVMEIHSWELAAQEDNPQESAAKPASTMILLYELWAALKNKKADEIDRILEELVHEPLDADVKAALDQISNEVLIAEYDQALETVKKIPALNLKAR